MTTSNKDEELLYVLSQSVLKEPYPSLMLTGVHLSNIYIVPSFQHSKLHAVRFGTVKFLKMNLTLNRVQPIGILMHTAFGIIKAMKMISNVFLLGTQ